MQRKAEHNLFYIDYKHDFHISGPAITIDRKSLLDVFEKYSNKDEEFNVILSFFHEDRNNRSFTQRYLHILNVVTKV